MRVLSREFSRAEKILLALLAVVLIALLYYQFVHVPVTDALTRAATEKTELESELLVAQAKEAKLIKMQQEIDSISADGSLKSMPSYNNSRNVTSLLNDVLGSLGYSITFSNVTRNGDQVRRNITLAFTAPEFADVQRVLRELTDSEYRCLIGDMNCTRNVDRFDVVTFRVAATVTFYETMVGGTADAGLPTAK